jgi:hypothetical protein
MRLETAGWRRAQLCGWREFSSQFVEKRPIDVILSEAKDLSICEIKRMQRSFVAYGSSG